MVHLPHQQPSGLRFVLSTLWQYRLLWVAPAVLGFGLAIAYALYFKVDSWSARQSFLVRDDLLGQSYKPGRFESLESMKSAQETILEISRRPQVIRNTMQQLGPAAGMEWDGTSPLPDEMIEDLQGSISLSAPNGAEFGKTEVIVLTAKANTRERSRKFIELLSAEVVNRVNEVRMLRLQSMEAELAEAHAGAVRQQLVSMEALEKLDQLLGPDVGVMNALNDSQAGDTPMKREITQIRAEMRGLETELEQAQTTLAALQHVYEQPDRIIFLSSDILRQQPALETMKVQLVGLQQSLALALGTLDEAHPKVIGLRLSVASMETQIFHSLVGEMEGVQSSIALRQQQLERLSRDVDSLEKRLVMLSGKRAEHLKLTTEVKQLTDSANRSQAALLEIQSLAHATRLAGLMTPVGEPQVASRPDGAGKKIIAAAGGLGGLLLGLGLVVLVAPPMVRNEASPARSERPSPSQPVAQAAAAPTAAKPIEPAVKPLPPVESKDAGYEQAVDAMRRATDTMRSAASMPNTPSLAEALARPSTGAPAQPPKKDVVGPRAESAPASPPLPLPAAAPMQPLTQPNPAMPQSKRPVDRPLPLTRPSAKPIPTATIQVPEVNRPQSGEVTPQRPPTTPLPVAGPKPSPGSVDHPPQVAAARPAPPSPAVPADLGHPQPPRMSNDLQTSRPAVGRIRPVDLVKSAEYQAKVEPAVKPVPPTPPQQFAGLNPPAAPVPPESPASKSAAIDSDRVAQSASGQPDSTRPPQPQKRVDAESARPVEPPAKAEPPAPRRSAAPTEPAPDRRRKSLPTVVDDRSSNAPGPQPAIPVEPPEDVDSGSIPDQIQKLHDTITRLMGPQSPAE